MEPSSETAPRKGVGRLALGLAALAALLAWIPWFGPGLALAALVVVVWRRREVPGFPFAVGLSLFGLALGGLFTAITLLWSPLPPTDAERAAWEAFDRDFRPPAEAPESPSPAAPTADPAAVPPPPAE